MSDHAGLYTLLGVGLGGIISYGGTALRDYFAGKKRKRQLHVALLVELRHLYRVITEEIARDVSPQFGIGVCLKRMNTDVLQSIRVSLAEYGGLVFLGKLAETYRDVTHTNEMLDRLETSAAECKKHDGDIQKQNLKENWELTVGSINTTGGTFNTDGTIKTNGTIKTLKDSVEAICRQIAPEEFNCLPVSPPAGPSRPDSANG
jgi:hypothetical protein